ncbi:phenylpyruvate tautomerase MIF-related protein, partial [Faecalibacillus intestinalis]|uniref:phenylpyruvate tautomerase MIF-related protein n=1 Tax=Faecalibacillus intestinalis TaxID=1982626 RepID=UPI002FDA7702
FIFFNDKIERRGGIIMPYISFKTNHKLTLRQENTIKSKSGELISLIPGKTEKALMIHMEDDQIMYFKGEETPCMMIEINLYKSAEFDDKKKLTEAMIQMIHETTKIEADNIYVIFHEFDHWGLNQTLI